jgi:SAM-dependent methyltransferase
VALTSLITTMLAPRIKPGHRIASMGYPDMIASPDVLETVLGVKYGALKYREDSEKICKWHGLPKRPIPDAASFFELFGATLDVFDIVETRGGEILCDLNEPLAVTDGYDFVLDVGTIEHCFNIGQAAKNMAGLLNEGGVIFHSNPHNSGNHGFYGLQPTWFADFYGQDGFKLLFCKLMQKGSEEPIDVPLTGRFSCGAPEINIFAGAQRVSVKDIRWPMQTKYAKLLAAAG